MEEITNLYLQFFKGELVFHHWNVHATLNLPSHNNLHKMGKAEYIPTCVSSTLKNGHYKNTTVMALKMHVTYN